jgi:hypothetical protein
MIRNGALSLSQMTSMLAQLVVRKCHSTFYPNPSVSYEARRGFAHISGSQNPIHITAPARSAAPSFCVSTDNSIAEQPRRMRRRTPRTLRHRSRTCLLVFGMDS